MNETFTAGSQAQYNSTISCVDQASGHDNTGLPSNAGFAAGTPHPVTVDEGDDIVCTITNKQKPKLTVTKLCPSGKQSPGDRFEVVLNGTRTGRILGEPPNCGDSTTFVLAHNSTQKVSEAVPNGNTTTNLANYTITIACNGSGDTVTLVYGDNKTCTITNARRTPRSQPNTPGYWKNHRAQTEALLPIMLGNYLVSSFSTVSAIFNGMNCSGTKDQDAVGCLAGHLLATKLNVKNGADNCINAKIAEGDTLLASIGYAGPKKTYTLTAQQRAQLIAVKDALDKYNNGLGCS
jgi:hypothetical protein